MAFDGSNEFSSHNGSQDDSHTYKNKGKHKIVTFTVLKFNVYVYNINKFYNTIVLIIMCLDNDSVDSVSSAVQDSDQELTVKSK